MDVNCFLVISVIKLSVSPLDHIRFIEMLNVIISVLFYDILCVSLQL